jgi:hypothetical protein
MTDLRDEFLSEGDLDLRNLTDEELIAYWNLWRPVRRGAAGCLPAGGGFSPLLFTLRTGPTQRDQCKSGQSVERLVAWR